MKKVLTYIQPRDFYQVIFLLLLICLTFICIYFLYSNPTASRPQPSRQRIDEQIKSITIQTPAGYTASEAIKNGKVLSIVWK